MRRRLLISQGIDYLEFKKTPDIVPSRSVEFEFVFELNGSKITPDQIVFESSNENITFGEVTFVSFKNKGTGKVTLNCNTNVAINTEITIVASTPYVNTSCTIKTINGILKNSVYICTLPMSYAGTIIDDYSGHIANIPASVMANKLSPISNSSSSTIKTLTYYGLNFVFACKAQYVDGTYVDSISSPELFNYYIGTSTTEYLSETLNGNVVIKQNLLYRKNINTKGSYYLNVAIDGEYNCLRITYPAASVVAQVSGTNITEGGQIINLDVPLNSNSSYMNIKGVNLNSSGTQTGTISASTSNFAQCIEDTSIVTTGGTASVGKGIKEDSTHVVVFIGSSTSMAEYIIFNMEVGPYAYRVSNDPSEIVLYEGEMGQISTYYKTYYYNELQSSVLVNSDTTYSVNNSAIISVDNNGLVTAISEGSALVYANYNNKRVSTKVTVKKQSDLEVAFVEIARGEMNQSKDFSFDDWQIGSQVIIEQNEWAYFKVFGYLNDGSMTDITEYVTLELHPQFHQYALTFGVSNTTVNGESMPGRVIVIHAGNKPIEALGFNIHADSGEDGYPDESGYLNLEIPS